MGRVYPDADTLVKIAGRRLGAVKSYFYPAEFTRLHGLAGVVSGNTTAGGVDIQDYGGDFACVCETEDMPADGTV